MENLLYLVLLSQKETCNLKLALCLRGSAKILALLLLDFLKKRIDCWDIRLIRAKQGLLVSYYACREILIELKLILELIELKNNPGRKLVLRNIRKAERDSRMFANWESNEKLKPRNIRGGNRRTPRAINLFLISGSASILRHGHGGR